MSQRIIVYKRKSEENEERQVASLESQEFALQRLIERDDYSVVADYAESQSAKKPGRRKFNEMCQLLQDGKADAILCWALNRLARNPVDGGQLMWLVQDKGIEIITPEKAYGIEDSLAMQVEFAMSNQFILDLSKNTKRGLAARVRDGVAPFYAPIGYLNDMSKPQGRRDVIPDPMRFSLVRKLWDKLLSEQLTAPQILDYANNQLHLTQKSGAKISRTGLYHLFSNKYYTGKFDYLGIEHRGSHPPMISEAEFERARLILNCSSKPHPSHREFAFTGGLITCQCGSSITAEVRLRQTCPICKTRFNAEKYNKCPRCGSMPEKQPYRYSYYHCASKTHQKCDQPYTSETQLEKQIDQLLATIELPQDFTDWALKQLRKANETEKVIHENVSEHIHTELQRTERRLNNLLDKYLSDANGNGEIISDDEYKHLKASLVAQKASLESEMAKNSERQDQWMLQAEETFNFARQARYWFKNGSMKDKRIILKTLGSNLKLINKTLCCDLEKPFIAMQQAHDALQNDLKPFEPTEFTIKEGKYVASNGSESNWGGWLDEVRTCLVYLGQTSNAALHRSRKLTL